MRAAWIGLVLFACGERGAAPSPGEAKPASPAAALAASAAVIPPGPERPEPGALPVADCSAVSRPEESELRWLERLLDQAHASFERDRIAEAWACADEAAELAPQSVEAHHLRAAALAALGHDGQAQLAYAMALALDPEDPETLRAAADFYINIKSDKGRDELSIGLELARRGYARATARRRGGGSLRAELALLEAQALNDLGRSDEALERADEAALLTPRVTATLHERGVSLFNLARFEEARAQFTRLLELTPGDAYAHQMLGRTYEWLGRFDDATLQFRRARDLAPEQFRGPFLISEEEFRGEIDGALAQLTPERRTMVASVPILIADLPSPQDLAAVDPPFPPTILGLFRGLPHGVEPVARRPIPPGEERAIVLYRRNLAHAVQSRAELTEQIAKTLFHEIGHLEGLDEGALRRRGLD